MSDTQLPSTSNREATIRLERLAQHQTVILAAVAIATWIFMRNLQLSHDIIWQFWVARQMLGGARLYGEIWEINPPLWFWSAIPVEWLAQLTGISWRSLLIPLLVASSAASAALTMRFVDLGNPVNNLLLRLIIFWLSAFVPQADLGQREYFMLMFGLPYAALIAFRTTGRAVPVAHSLVVGLLGSYGFALKHYFLLVPIALELWLYLSATRSWRLWRPEVILMVSLAVIYAICVAWLSPEFFTFALPMVKTAYWGYDGTLRDIIFHRTWGIFWIFAAAFLVPIYRLAKPNLAPANLAFIRSLLILAICSLASYVIQLKGSYYYSLPATGALIVVIAVCLIHVRTLRLISVFTGSILLYLPLSTVMLIQDNSVRFVQLADKLLSHVPAGEPVFVASGDPQFWTALERHNVIWPSRASSLWMLPAIAQSEVIGPSSPQLRELAKQVNEALIEDLRCNPPAVILFPNSISVENWKFQFPLKEFFFSNKYLRDFIENEYYSVEADEYTQAYARRNVATKPHSGNCRVIH
jgi:hypothetical protein